MTSGGRGRVGKGLRKEVGWCPVCLAWTDPELDSQHCINPGLVAHAYNLSFWRWRPEDPLKFKVILGSESAASPGLYETLSKPKQQKAGAGREGLVWVGRAVGGVK